MVLDWYALLASCWSGLRGSRHSLLTGSRHPFQMVVLFLMTCTASSSKSTVHPASTRGDMPMRDSVARPGRICALRAVASNVVGTIMSQSWVLDKRCPPAVPTMIGLSVGRTFVLGAFSFKNIPVAPVSARPVSSLSTSVLVGGRTSGIDFSRLNKFNACSLHAPPRHAFGSSFTLNFQSLFT